ncbi:MAG: putative bifunctional diguanylate cyclase/phosphodiesterase [Spirochaetota bacterium]
MTGSNMENARIIIVEDERIIALDLREQLRRFGCEVLGIHPDAESAIAAVAKHVPDLVLMDVMIHGPVDGIEAARLIRETTHVPIVFLTAYSDDATLERAKEVDPHGYVLKPFKERELYSAIQIALHKAEMEQRLVENKVLLDSILETIDDAVVSVGADLRVRFANPSAQKLFGLHADEIAGQRFDSVCRLYEDGHSAHVPLFDDIENQGRMLESIHLRGKHNTKISVQGSIRPVLSADKVLDGYTIALRDVSDVKRITQSLSYQANHDSLTGLLNRDSFINKMARTIAVGRPEHDSQTTASVYLYADLDHFKIVNDVCGHAAGDELLRQISEDLERDFADVELKARVGDDEFGIFLEKIPENEILSEANRFYELICRNFEWRTHKFSITTTVAAVPVQSDTSDPFRILAAADDACYMTKDHGGNSVRLYERTEYSFRKRRDDMHWAPTLNNALDREQLILFSQPIMHIQSREIRKKEILVRLRSDEGEFISPGQFIPAAERYNLMPALDRYILTKTFEYLHQFGYSDPCMYCINLSGTTLTSPGLFEFIEDLLGQFQLSGNRFCFEITETAAIQNFGPTVELIQKIRELGCFFALDDFGNGFSSFAYLKNLPVDYLKIDGSFVQHILRSDSDRAMVEAINNIGHVLNMQTIAEFVTNSEMIDILDSLSVDYAQGYEIAMPAILAADAKSVRVG